MNTRNYRVILPLLCAAFLGGLWGCREPLPTQTPGTPLISATTTSAPEASPEPSATYPRPSATQAPSVEANATAMPTQSHTPHPTAAPGALAAEAQAAAEQGDWERALGLWQEAIAKASDDERGAWQVALARTLVRAVRGSEALAPLEAALTESPEGPAAGDAWGLVGGSENASGWGLALMVALVLKEFIGLFAAGGQSVSREPPGHWKEHAADLFLLAYGCVAYTAWWQAIVDLEAVGEGPLGPRLALMPVLVPLFLFFYLPMRLPFLLDEYHLRPARGRRGRLAAELAIGAVLGLWPAIR